MTETLHPARSPEFLSRLYDGELAASDREAFDAHRAACAECRTAAETFAASLAAFRASPTAPPAADLSARILRKIRAQSPSRRPFGVMFGIDVRWAGVFVAALVVVLLSAPLLLRRAEPTAAPSNAIPARIVDSAPGPPTAAPAAPPVAESAPPVRVAAGAPGELKEERAPAKLAEAAPVQAPAAASAKDAAATLAAPAPAAANAAPEAPRLTVRPLDGEGPAPEILGRPAAATLAALSGRELVVSVAADGTVLSAEAPAAAGALARQKAAADRELGTPPGDALAGLKFAPGGRPRRLAVRVE